MNPDNSKNYCLMCLSVLFDAIINEKICEIKNPLKSGLCDDTSF
jgi:hypothetical protein